MIDLRLEKDRRSGWGRQLEPNLESWWHENMECLPVAYKGPAIVSVPARKLKVVDVPKLTVVRAMPEERSVLPVTPGEMARMYLKQTLKLNGVERLRHRLTDRVWAELVDPTYYQPTGRIRAVEVDLVAAHWNVARVAPLDLRMCDGFTSLAGSCEWASPERVDQLPKQVRLALTGIIGSKSLTMYKAGVPHEVNHLGEFFSPCLIGLVHATLQAVAWEMVQDFGCVHVATDAYIVPEARADAAREYIRNRWQLDTTVKARGMYQTWNLNVWDIEPTKQGDIPKRTKHVERARGDAGRRRMLQRKEASMGSLTPYPAKIRGRLADARRFLAERPHTPVEWEGTWIED